MSGSGISWAICKSAPCPRQITTPASQHSVFYRPDALPAAQPTASKHWRDLRFIALCWTIVRWRCWMWVVTRWASYRCRGARDYRWVVVKLVWPLSTSRLSLMLSCPASVALAALTCRPISSPVCDKLLLQVKVLRPMSHSLPSVLWHCWLGGRKGIRPVKNWVLGCWRGYLSGAMCRFAYGPADATATHCLLLQ